MCDGIVAVWRDVDAGLYLYDRGGVMPEIEINDIARVGSVQDVKPYMLPPEAWTLAENMRYDEGDALKTLDGWGEIFGTPTWAPHFGMVIAKAGSIFTPAPGTTIVLYVSLNKAAQFDGVTHSDKTRTVGGNYTATNTRQWNGTILGGIPIFNNGVDIPQYVASVGTGTFEDLLNWPVALRASVVRAFGPFLVAFNTKDGVSEYPHRVQWSHPASPGALPSSWDKADPTKDAGDVDLPDAASGIILDALPLGSIMYVYKENAIWRMRFIGGQSKFDFGQSAWVTGEGLLGMGSVAISGDGTKHVLATTSGDIIWHDGNTVQSVLSRRQRARLQSDLDPTNARNSFMFADPFNHNMWFCYPSQGNEHPNRALILSYRSIGGKEFTVTEADGITFRNAMVGNIPVPQFDLWDEDDGIVWDDDTTIWDPPLLRRKVMLLDPTASRFYGLGDSTLRNGVEFTSTLRREGLALIGRKRNGEWIVDHQQVKMVRRLWPKITGASVRVRAATQEHVDGAVAWTAVVDFDPATMDYCDPGPVSGRAVGVEFASEGVWRMDGYKIDIAPTGKY